MNINPSAVYISDYDYNLPSEQIAEHPLLERDSSRLLVYKDGTITDHIFKDLPEQIPAGARLVVNNTRVIEARLFFTKNTGAQIEIFCLSPHQPAEMTQSLMQPFNVQWNCLIGGASKWKPGQLLHKKVFINDNELVLTARYVGKSGEQFIIDFSWTSNHAFAEVLHAAGAIPLPPYIKRRAVDVDAERYQTVFAQHQGSVAAPTAALHFTENVFRRLSAKGINTSKVTLHVGAGTFKPVKSETIADHSMHAENFSVSAGTLAELIQSETIVAVGTTSLRTLESLHWLGVKLKKGNADLTLGQWEALTLADDDITYKESLQVLLDYLNQNNQDQLICNTSLIILPGYTFKSAQALVTNFHQPRSTLLLLVAAFIGDDWKKVYQHALNNHYRFLSYGDSSLLWKKSS